MQTEHTVIEHAASMPAITWHFLGANDTDIEIPAGFTLASEIHSRIPETAQGALDDFENALARAQEAWALGHPEPTAAERAEQAAFLAAEADATYGGTAQSSYQAKADALEDARSLAHAFEQGVGNEVAAFLRHAADNRMVIAAETGTEVDAQVIVKGIEGAVSVAAIDIVAQPRSTINLSLVVDVSIDQGASASPNDGTDCAGITGTTLRVFADYGSRVNIVRIQALDEHFEDVDDMGLFAAADARIEVRQTVLGTKHTLTGLAGDLRGDASSVEVDTRYLGQGDQELDFNYVLRHHGRNTKCKLQANGVLAGKSKKTLRGTIDLIRGCKGAEGSENESVLLVGDDVRNKTVPVILCNEDDVAGNHGATIGHIRGAQLFYLESRGLSPEMAERLFMDAMLEQAAIDAVDDASRAAVVRLGERLLPGFCELFNEEK